MTCSTFSANTTRASRLVVVMVVSSDMVRKYSMEAKTSAAIAASMELPKIRMIYRWTLFTLFSSFLCCCLTLLYSDVTSAAASAASSAMVILS